MTANSIDPGRPIAVVGLGQMGVPVAERLLQAGHKVFGATRGKPSASFLDAGGTIVEGIPSLAEARIILSLVTDDAAVRDITFGTKGITEALPEQVIHVAMGSLSLDLCHELETAHAAAGQSFVAAPVFGRPDAAAAGALSIVCSGRKAGFDQVEAVLRLLGRATWIGDGPHLSNLVKLAGNQMIFTAVELLGEVFALLRKADIAESVVPQLLLESLFPGPIFTGYAKRIMERDWSGLPTGLQIARKDNAHCVEAAEAMGADLPLFRFLRDRIALAAAQGPADITTLARLVALQSGLDD